MVLTCPVRIDNTAGHGPVGWPRRRLLRGMAVLAAGASAAPLAGCGLFDHHQSDATPDALQPLITEALELAARYEAAVGAFPELADRLGPVAQDHRAHAAE